jgi:hypothetical protein
MVGFVSDETQIALERAKIELENLNKAITFPEFATGARSVIYVNDVRIAAALDVSYSVNIEHTELRTIDSQLPWELIPGQISIEATLRRIVHPDTTVTQDNLFTIIQAALHTPYAGLKIQDKLGNVLFYAKGSFTSLQGNIAVGQANIETVRFQGYYWRQNDAQAFYPVAATSIATVLKRLANAKLGAVKSLGTAAGF